MRRPDPALGSLETRVLRAMQAAHTMVEAGASGITSTEYRRRITDVRQLVPNLPRHVITEAIATACFLPTASAAHMRAVSVAGRLAARSRLAPPAEDI